VACEDKVFFCSDKAGYPILEYSALPALVWLPVCEILATMMDKTELTFACQKSQQLLQSKLEKKEGPESIGSSWANNTFLLNELLLYLTRCMIVLKLL
jgi:hypothetical protein